MGAYTDRDALLKTIGYADYKAYRASDLWKGIRRRVLERDGRKCRLCQEWTGIVHHDLYDKPTMLGDTLEHLYSLCDDCHRKIEFDGQEKRTFRDVRQELKRKLREAMGLPSRRSEKKKRRRKRRAAKLSSRQRSLRAHGKFLERTSVPLDARRANPPSDMLEQLLLEHDAWRIEKPFEKLPKHLRLKNIRNAVAEANRKAREKAKADKEPKSDPVQELANRLISLQKPVKVPNHGKQGLNYHCCKHGRAIAIRDAKAILYDSAIARQREANKQDNVVQRMLECPEDFLPTFEERVKARIAKRKFLERELLCEC